MAQMEEKTPKSETRYNSNIDDLRSSTTSHAKYLLFCKLVGMEPDLDAILPTRAAHKPNGLYPRVVKACRDHSYQYWFVAVFSNGLLWLQICLGATLAALGGSAVSRPEVAFSGVATAVTVLSAIQTVIGGFIIYFKSRAQPNRARQFRNSLKRCKDHIEDAAAMFKNESCALDVQAKVNDLTNEYENAVSDAQANYPDLWQAGVPPRLKSQGSSGDQTGSDSGHN